MAQEFECNCPACDCNQSDGHGYDDGGESSTGLCLACELAGCDEGTARCDGADDDL